MNPSSSWLLPDGMDRERMVDMDRRIRPVRKATFGVIALSLVFSAPTTGPWTLAALAVAVIGFRLGERRIDSSPRPEYGLFAAWACSQVMIAGSVALTGGPDSPGLAWLAIPLVTLGSRFSHRGIALGVTLTLGLLAGVTFGIDPAGTLADPATIAGQVALILSVTMFITVLTRSDVENRADAVIDQLTGMLNRKALAARVAELSQQSRVTGEPIGLILGDLDRFGSVNDTHGHATGDAVLKDVAYTLRKTLRAFDLVYRLGGEEFLVIVPGADLDGATEIAERLRFAVAADPVGGGLEVTMSFGVAATPPGGTFDYDALFAVADAALYEAKADGRDRVCSSRGVTPLALAA